MSSQKKHYTIHPPTSLIRKVFLSSGCRSYRAFEMAHGLPDTSLGRAMRGGGLSPRHWALFYEYPEFQEKANAAFADFVKPIGPPIPMVDELSKKYGISMPSDTKKEEAVASDRLSKLLG